MAEFLKLKKSNCKNCYKCIRNCPVKSIRFSAGQANIVPEECILCGRCFVVCPQNAKEIVSELETVKVLMMSGDPVIASLAPSFVANYNGAGIASMRQALKKLGFADAEETAIGAKLVKSEYDRMLAQDGRDIIISSCCHSVNLLIQKHFPDLISCLADIVSPMQAHCLDIKRRIPNAKTVFIGPCLAKKDEGDRYPGIVDAVLTFEELTEWMDEQNVTIEHVDEPSNGSEGLTRLFPTTGGILKSMNCDAAGYNYIALDGVENCIAALNDIRNGAVHNCFIEMSACAGSCIGGPVMEKYHPSPLKDFTLINAYAGKTDFKVDPLPKETMAKLMPNIREDFNVPTEVEIKEILAKMGKTKPEDELNCGTCGYNSCREKAIAVYRGKAEISMCLPFLKERAESFSGNIINNTPNGIIVLNEDLEVQQINRSAMNIMNIRNAGDVLGEPLIRILDPKDFLEVLNTGRGIYNKRIYLAEYKRYVEKTIIFDRSYRVLMCIMRDVTEEESEREKKETISRQTVEIADKVVDKQMRIVQEIASLLGETAAETKIALTKLKESIENE